VNYPKTKRLGITFAGIPAASIDFSSLHPHLLLRIFHGQDKEVPGMLSSTIDPYDIPTFRHLPRQVHKKCLNTLLNAKTQESAKRSLINTHYWYDAVEDDLVVVSYDRKVKRKGLKAFPGNIPEVDRYISEFMRFHPELGNYVCRGVGNAMQWLDSEIMLMAIRLGVETGVPLLPVHDEIVFPSDRANDVEYLLMRSVQTVLKDYGSFGRVLTKQSWLEDGELRSKVRLIELKIY
jgi:hypothetical protein